VNPSKAFMTPCAAGPKMRKWYGEGERLPRDGGAAMDDDDLNGAAAPATEEAEAPVVCDSVLVTDAETPMGELVVLKLILARCAFCSQEVLLT